MSYQALRNKQAELIRKALDGSAFVADVTADPIESITTATGTAPDVVIDLATLPTGYDDLGWLTEDGVAFARDVTNSEVTSWGSVTPTRTDVVSDTSTITVVCQETKARTIAIATGADLDAITADPDTGEVSIAKPTRPTAKHYRVLTLAVDEAPGGEIYIGRFFPRAKVTSFAEQTYAGGDQAITWGVTFTGEEDSTLGYSERYLFGGAGWFALLADMGISATP